MAAHITPKLFLAVPFYSLNLAYALTLLLRLIYGISTLRMQVNNAVSPDKDIFISEIASLSYVLLENRMPLLYLSDRVYIR